MTAAPSNTDIDDLISLASSLLHQSDQHALLLYLPQRYGGQNRRRIEDRLLAQGLNMDVEVSLAYEVQPPRQRQATFGGRLKLCYSEKACGNEIPRWLSGKAGQGSITEIPLLRMQEMRRLVSPDHLGAAAEAYNMSPAERCMHRGPPSAMRLMDCLIQDSGLDQRRST